MNHFAQIPSNARSAEIKLVKIAADGTRTPAGRIRWHRNPLINAAWHVEDKIIPAIKQAGRAIFDKIKELPHGN